MVNEWTSNDVPSVSSLGLYNRRPDLDLDGKRFGAAAALEAVVAHLNAHHPKPATGLLSSAADCVLRSADRVRVAEAEADRWRSAYEIVEGERDLARSERDEWEGKYLDTDEVLHRTCRERDEVRERADQLRDERDDAVQSCITVGRDRDHWRARAEAAEARTAPAVTSDEVWRVVAAHDPGDDEMALCRVNRLTDALCRLFGVEAEPAVDPLLDKAQEFAALADWELTDREAWLLHKVAAHVLGQEGK